MGRVPSRQELVEEKKSADGWVFFLFFRIVSSCKGRYGSNIDVHSRSSGAMELKRPRLRLRSHSESRVAGLR